MRQQARRTAGRRTGLPETLTPFFWDHDFAGLSWDSDRDLIISRLLSAGTWDAITWLRRRAGDDALRAWICARQGRGLSAPQLRFWELVLDLPHREVSGWLADNGQHVWAQRTHR